MTVNITVASIGTTRNNSESSNIHNGDIYLAQKAMDLTGARLLPRLVDAPYC